MENLSGTLWMKKLRGSQRFSLAMDPTSGHLITSETCPCYPNYELHFTGAFNSANAIGCDTGTEYSYGHTSWDLYAYINTGMMPDVIFNPSSSRRSAPIYLSGTFNFNGTTIDAKRLMEPEEEEDPPGWGPIYIIYTPSGWFTENCYQFMYIQDNYQSCVNDCNQQTEPGPDRERCLNFCDENYGGYYTRYSLFSLNSYSIGPWGCGGNGNDILQGKTVYRPPGVRIYLDTLILDSNTSCGEGREGLCPDLQINGYQFVTPKIENSIPFSYDVYGNLIPIPIGKKECEWHSEGSTFNAVRWGYSSYEGGTIESSANGFSKVEISKVE